MTTWTSFVNDLVRSRTKVALIGFLLIAGVYLATEHTAHLFSALPFLLLSACLLMHVFMHGGHGTHGDHTGHGGESDHITRVGQADRAGSSVYEYDEQVITGNTLTRTGGLQ